MKKTRIMLIDDDPLFLFLTERTLRPLPHLAPIDSMNHVKEAREYLDECIANEVPIPDVIFLDINMPGIGGMDFADLYSRKYAELFPETKLVILTSSISRKTKEKSLEIPAVDYFIQKPLTKEKLERVLNN